VARLAWRPARAELDQEHPARRQPSLSKRASDCTWPESREVGEELPEGGEHLPIGSRIRNQEHEGLGRVVAALQIDPAAQRLNIAKAHFELDRASIATVKQNGIPGSAVGPVGDDRERNLSAMHERRLSGLEKPLEAPGVPNVSQWWPCRIQSNAGLEARGRRDPIQFLKTKRRKEAALD
jgi:hypothetical protein